MKGCMYELLGMVLIGCMVSIYYYLAFVIDKTREAYIFAGAILAAGLSVRLLKIAKQRRAEAARQAAAKVAKQSEIALKNEMESILDEYAKR